MFGYITPCKCQLGEDGFEQFRAYYCGLCKAMGNQCSQASRLGLSYDAAFLAIALSSALEHDCVQKYERCIVHPFKKNLCVKHDKAVNYSACMGVMLSYLKLLDDWRDERSIKALGGMALLWSGVVRARRRYPKEYKYIRDRLNELSRLEDENCGDIDKAADCFARILQRLFTPEFIEDRDTRRILDWMGYNIGRWIFVIDAVNDLERDYKKKNYNPFLADFDGDISEYVKTTAKNSRMSLTFTLENAASAFELLKIYKNSELLYKMIYDSLRVKQDTILNKIGEN